MRYDYCGGGYIPIRDTLKERLDMSDTKPVAAPEEEVHPSEQGPFEAGKVVPLGGQPVPDEPKVVGRPAADKVQAKTDAVNALTLVQRAITKARDGLSTNPVDVTTTTRSELSFLLNHVTGVLKKLGG